MSRPLRIAIVAGEESGDLLGVDLVNALVEISGAPVSLVGVGGRHLQAAGLDPLFESSEIALMGVSAVLRDLPRLIRRIGQTARAIVDAKPDCLVTIDVPDFSLRVARKVRALDPSIPIVHYVCPSVWAWRPGRAPAMRPHVDRILCLLPFEPEALERLGGPAGTYVGHRLTTHTGIVAAAKTHASRAPGDTKNLLVLPGSRRSEVRRLLGSFGETVTLLASRGHKFSVTIPTVPHVAQLVEEGTATWPIQPTIIGDEAGKWAAFGTADAALAASGTVSLELALSRVPLVSCYRADPLFGPVLMRMITSWTGSLPNLVADWPIVPEYYDAHIRPERLAREIERLWANTATRQAQLSGFETIAERMRTEFPSGKLAAEAVFREISSWK